MDFVKKIDDDLYICKFHNSTCVKVFSYGIKTFSVFNAGDNSMLSEKST